MTQTSTDKAPEQLESTRHETLPNSPDFDMFATGVVTGVVVTTIVEAGKGAIGILAKNPLVMLGAGIMTGYFAHKYRKEIILSSTKVTEHTKGFVSRQKQNFVNMLAETEENS